MKGILELATASQSINEKKIFQQSNIRKEFANITEEIFNIDQENIWDKEALIERRLIGFLSRQSEANQLSYLGYWELLLLGKIVKIIMRH